MFWRCGFASFSDLLAYRIALDLAFSDFRQQANDVVPFHFEFFAVFFDESPDGECSLLGHYSVLASQTPSKGGEDTTERGAQGVNALGAPRCHADEE